MSEAEDVLLEVAERVSAPLRARWSRARDPDTGRSHPVDAMRLEIQVFLVGIFGGSWTVLAAPAARERGVLRRWWMRFWPESDDSASWHEASALHLVPPSHVRAGAAEELRSELLCTALSLAGRCVRGSTRLLSEDPLARDLFWMWDARACESLVRRALPGLSPMFRESRSRAFAARRATGGMTALERRMEEELRTQLTRDCASDEPPEVLAERAIRTARHWRDAGRARARYRGVPPVACWGVPRRGSLPFGASAPPEAPTVGVSGRPIRLRSESAPDLAETEREAPLLIPPGDPHGSVAPAGRVGHPPDTGSEELDTLAEELERLGSVMRLRRPGSVREILEAETSAHPDSRKVEPAVAGARAYPEWDYRVSDYRRQYCLVRELASGSGDADWAARVRQRRRATLRALRREAQRLRPRLERRPRELQGEELDLDAWVEARADWRALGLEGERLYLDQRRRRRDLAVLLLLDASASTDRWIGPGRRVIDVVRESALLFCEAAAPVGDRHAVWAFRGTGPLGVGVVRLKSFEEPFGDRTARRLAHLEPAAYTRIGGALRHAGTALARVAARHRLVLLLSDGAPNDVDEYEGRYGVEDTRRAAGELRLAGIRVHCVAIDPVSSTPLAHIFGRAGHSRLRDPARLPDHVSRVYRQLARG